MPAVRDVAVLVGSLRKESFTRKMALALAELAPRTLRLEIVAIRHLDLYDENLEEQPPASWVAFRDHVRRADAVLFATPEYNRSVPGGLKNAIDVGSRQPETYIGAAATMFDDAGKLTNPITREHLEKYG